MSITYHNRLREKTLCRCAAMRAAKEQKRIAEAEAWTPIGTWIMRASSSPDGRHMSVELHGRRDLLVTGTARTISGKIVREIIRKP